MLKGPREDRKQEVGKSVLLSSLQMCPRIAVVKQEEEGCLARRDAFGLALTLRTGEQCP